MASLNNASDSDFENLVNVWPSLPPSIRRGILALAQATLSGH